MDGRESSNTSPYFSYPSSFSFFTPNDHTHFTMFSTLEFDAKAEADTGNFNSFTPSEHSSCAKSDTDSCSEPGGDASDDEEEEVSLDELLLDGKTKEKFELLAAMVGIDTTDPVLVLNEVVRVLKVLKRINQFSA